MRSLRHVINSPLITEKGTMVNETSNQFLFKVRPEANKVEIKRAVETFFKVKVDKVRTINYLGRKKRVGRSVGQKPAWKKAYVTLVAGQRIDFFEGN